MSPFRRCGLQRDNPAVYFGAHATVADFGVNGIGKVDGGGLARQDDHLAFGGEGVDLFGIEIDLEGGEELARIAHFLLPLQDVAQPGEAFLVLLAPSGCPSLYFQWAAMPTSATRCISSVRSCTSKGWP